MGENKVHFSFSHSLLAYILSQRPFVQDVIGVDMDESGRLLVTGSDDTTAMVWDLRMGQPLAVLRQHTGEVRLPAHTK